MGLKVQGKIRREWSADHEIVDYSYIIDTIDDLEDFIAYNRAYLVSMEFIGQLNRESE